MAASSATMAQVIINSSKVKPAFTMERLVSTLNELRLPLTSKNETAFTATRSAFSIVESRPPTFSVAFAWSGRSFSAAMVRWLPIRRFWKRSPPFLRAALATLPVLVATCYLYVESRYSERLLLEAETARTADNAFLPVPGFCGDEGRCPPRRRQLRSGESWQHRATRIFLPFVEASPREKCTISNRCRGSTHRETSSRP